MRVLKVMFIGMIVSVFLVGQAYSAHKGNHANGNNRNANNGNVNNGNNGNNGNNNNANRVRNNNSNRSNAQAAVHRRQARRSSEANRRREERNRSSQRNSTVNNNSNNNNNDIALNNRAARTNNGRRNGREMRNERANRSVDLLNSLNRARWSHNPHDTRGQGNRGRPDMQDPFGHDRDSNRKELYGNNGRPIRVSDEELEPTEEVLPTEEELSAEDLIAEETTPTEEVAVVEEEVTVEVIEVTEAVGSGSTVDGTIETESAYEVGDVILLDNPMFTHYAATLIEYYEAEGNQDYADYLREFYNLTGTDLSNFSVPDESHQLTVTEGITPEDIMNVNYTELVDIYALQDQLNDSGFDYWLNNIEGSRAAAEEDPRIGLTEYTTTMELYLSNYLIANYPELAQQIVDGEYQAGGTEQAAEEEAAPTEEVVVIEEVIEETTPTEEVAVVEEEVTVEEVIQEEIASEETLSEEDSAIIDEVIALLGEAVDTILNLEESLSFDWQTINEDAAYYQEWADYFASIAANPDSSAEVVELYTQYADMYQQYVSYYDNLSYQEVYLRGDATIDYTLNLNLPEENTETTLLVTTSLVVSESFETQTRVWNSETGQYDYTTIYYEAGQVIDTVEEETVLTADSSDYAFSYDPPGDILEGNEWNYDGGFFDVVVNVTEVDTESTYTQTFDRSLYLYRDPYGNVEDAMTGEKVVGAKITVFTENGSIVALDKASNPTASNPQMTDATGRFGFNLRADRKYYMVASAPGYEDYQSDVFTEQWHVIREDIKMQPKLEQMASNMK